MLRPKEPRPISPEERELDQFLAALPRWEQRILTLEEGEYTPAEVAEMQRGGRSLPSPENEQRYSELLARCPRRFREHRRRLQRFTISILLPPVRRGAPTKHVLGEEAAALAQAGRNKSQIANALNQKYGPGTTTTEKVRHLLNYRKGRSAPSRK